MIQSYPKDKQFHSLMNAKEYEKAVRTGLDFLRFVADEYIRLEVYVKALSSQWLSRHHDEIDEAPGMIVIDEAHHALAKTYKEMWGIPYVA